MHSFRRIFLKTTSILCKNRSADCCVRRRYLYEQGQSPAPNIREYFYYIDHQGMVNGFKMVAYQLFMDDARIKNFTSCFKEKKFLVFFFKRIRVNQTGRYEKDFPYVSLCGRERNYIRCDDVPFVYTHIVPDKSAAGEYKFCYAHAGEELHEKFEPEKLIMLPKTARVYHPAPERVGGLGLVRSSLAIELSKSFDFENGEYEPPTHFTWNNKKYKLEKWYTDLPPDEEES